MKSGRVKSTCARVPDAVTVRDPPSGESGIQLIVGGQLKRNNVTVGPVDQNNLF